MSTEDIERRASDDAWNGVSMTSTDDAYIAKYRAGAAMIARHFPTAPGYPATRGVTK